MSEALTFTHRQRLAASVGQNLCGLGEGRFTTWAVCLSSHRDLIVGEACVMQFVNGASRLVDSVEDACLELWILNSSCIRIGRNGRHTSALASWVVLLNSYADKKHVPCHKCASTIECYDKPL